ncbi:MAG: efflux RND transporter permease subunit [Saprospiraceae bacterium]
MANILEEFKKELREFSITSLAVDNRTSIFLFTFMILLFGVGSYTSMPKEAYPEIPWPKKYVNTIYFGNSASDIESLITRPLEKEITSISGIKKVTSQSMQDYSVIIAEFNSDIDSDVAVQKLKDAVDKAKSELPDDLKTDPEVVDINMAELPVMTINLSGPFSNDELNGYAEYLKDEIKDLREISEVDLKGVMDKEIAIEVDLPKMESMQVSFNDIENAVRGENITMSGGEIVADDFRRTIRIVGELKTIPQFENLIVKSENQQPIFLKDIAKVSFGFQDQTSIARADMESVISLDIIKKKGENLLSASDKIKIAVEDAKRNAFPENLNVNVFNDQSEQTRMMVANLQNSIISGVILVVIVLLFFLGIRNSLFVGVAIPLSMLMGILILNVIGYSLNMVVLFSLILALGMLVDNAIVVVENVYRYMQNGYKSVDAAKFGTGEVALPIIASTATTLAAFVPLAFWPGLMGQFMRYLPITLIIVLTSSLFVALIINPVFTSALMQLDEKAESAEVRRRKVRNILILFVAALAIASGAHVAEEFWLRNILGMVAIISVVNFFVLRPASFYFQNKVLPLLEKGYNAFISFALKKYNPLLFFGGTVGLLFFTFMLLGANMPKVILFPEADPLYVNAFVELPMGTDIKNTDEILSKVETKVMEVIEPYDEIVEAVLTQIGENTSDPNGEQEFGASPHKARLTVSFVPSEDRVHIGKSSRDAMEDIREGLKDLVPGVQIVVDQNQDGPPTGKDLNIEIIGDDVNTLATTSEELVSYLESKNIPGIEELKKDVNIGKPELLVNIDREAAQRFGISTFAIADAIRTAVFGKEISKYKDEEDDYPITLRLAPAYRYSVSDILNQRITFRSPSNGRISQVPIGTVADVRYSSTYSSIKRKDQERVVTVYSNVTKDYTPDEVLVEVRDAINDFQLPEGYKISFTGQAEQQQEEMDFLITALGLAIFGILLIIVAQFNSLISPIIILMSVLFSTIGVFLGYVFTGMNIEIVMTGVGIISLAGIVVNNAIVLIDYVNLLIKRKRVEAGYESMSSMPKEMVKAAIIEGGGTRLRPVLLTAITTVLGLIPLAIGFNIDFYTLITDLNPNIYIGGDNAAFWGTMAWTVIYGLVFATFLTLVVVPVMYWLAYRGQSAFSRMLGGGERARLEPAE